MAKPQPKPAAPQKPKAKQKPVAQGPGFMQFLIAREQWIDWALIGGLFVAIFIFLRIYYPYPQTESDTGKYIESAMTGKVNCYRPYGYSSLLSFFHGISADVRFVMVWQWFATFISVALFLFTVKFIFRYLPRPAFILLCIVTILNPSVIFMDSYIMSDSIFLSLTLLFLTTMMWILYSGSYLAMACHLLLLWWCMYTRYIGLFYPLLSSAVLAWALWRKHRWIALVGVAVPVIMLLFFRSMVTDAMKDEFGVETFSGFAGWQKANNGVAILPYVKVDESEISDPQMKVLHQIVRQFPDSFFRDDAITQISFMWTPQYPGKTYLGLYLQNMRKHDPTYDYSKAWLEVGDQMGAYGSFLQSHYPAAFFKSYLWPNFKKVFVVYDILDVKDSISYKDVSTFYTSGQETYHYRLHFFRSLTGIRTIGDAIVWLSLILSIIAGIVMWRRLGWTIEQKLIVAGLLAFVGAFIGASVIAAPIGNFRYMIPLIYVQLTVPVLVVSAIISGLKKPQSTGQVPTQP